jgi:hypothetical protein
VRKKLRIKSKPDIPTFKSGPCSSILLDSPCPHSWMYICVHESYRTIVVVGDMAPVAVQCIRCPAFIKFD